MEGTLKPTRDSQPVFVLPSAKGWRVTTVGAAIPARDFATLGEAVAMLPANSKIHLALPCSALLFERMHFPSADPVELDGMVRLQLEKTLPFPIEDVTSGFEIVGQTGNESVVLAVAVNNTQLNALAKPFRERQLLPKKITAFASHVAAQCPKDLLVCVIYKEAEKFVLAISESGRLGFAQTLAASDADALLAEIPQALFSAEMDGIPTTFARAQLDAECPEMHAAIGGILGVPVDSVSFDSMLAEAGNNLVPSTWVEEQKRAKNTAQIKSRIILAGTIYLVALACAFGYLLWMQAKVSKLNKQISAVQPELDSIRKRKARWSALAPAIDRTRYTVELLSQIQKNLPAEAIRITQFDQRVNEFEIDGEAPTANLAIEFSEQLKKNPGLKDFKISTSQPAILANEHAQFKVFAKP